MKSSGPVSPALYYFQGGRNEGKQMYEWHEQIRMMVDEIDRCIMNRDDEALTLFMSQGNSGKSPA